MQEYSESNWPIQDMIGAFPDGWNDIAQEMMMSNNECDVCEPPLDIGPPPPLPASYQEMIEASESCNVCNMISHIEPSVESGSSSVMAAIIASILVITILIIALAALCIKNKKFRSLFTRDWVRRMLTHTDITPSTLPSPSPSTERLKSRGTKLWRGSSHSIQSENIYEVCSPSSQDSLYEEVGASIDIKYGSPSPYGIVLVNKDTGLSVVTPGGDTHNIPSNRPILKQNLGIMYQQQMKSMYVSGMPVPHFSTFGSSGRGFINPVVRDTVGNNGFMYPESAHTLGSGQATKNMINYSGNLENKQLQKRKLPPVPSDNANFSL